MERIKTINRAIDMFGPGKDGFRAAVPGVSEPTYLSADFFNGVQESLLQLQEMAGLAPSNDYTQVAQAVKILADRMLDATKIILRRARQIADAVFIFDGESTNARAEGGTGWPELVMSKSNFAGRGESHIVAIPGRNMADTVHDYYINVRPLILAAVAAGLVPYVFIQSGLNDYGLRPASAWFVSFDEYVSAVAADGGVLVPMLCTRRLDWREYDGVRGAINAHILQLGNPLTIPTDMIFTDPTFEPRPGIINQSDDGTHANVGKRNDIANVVNEIMTAGTGFAHIEYVRQQRALTGSQIPFTNALGQLTTDGTLSMRLSIDAFKSLALTLSNYFDTAGATDFELEIPGEFKAWAMRTIGDTSDFSPELVRSLVFFDRFANLPQMSISTWRGFSTLYHKWMMQRGGVGSTPEPVASACAYPAANNTPGYPGQIAYNGAKTKFAMYAGDGISSHSWISSPVSLGV